MKAILVGLGGRGRHWLNACRVYPGVELVAYVEPAEANRTQAIEEFDVPAAQIYPSLSEAAAASQADFVVDVTPPVIHESVAMEAFAAKLHLLGEKPLSDNYEAARRMATAGRKAGVRHMVTQNYRFEGLPRTTRRLLSEGLIGDCAQLDVSLYVNWADNPGSHYVTEPYMFLTDMGIHHFDMMRYTLRLEPLSVRAITWNLPWGWHQGDACQLILFQFENDVVATHRGVGCTVGSVPAGHNGEWRYEGQAGTLTWEGFELFHSHQHRADPKVREILALDTSGLAENQNPVLHEFVTALEDGRDPECNSEDNLKSMAMVFGALKSARENGTEVILSEL
ncbi:MAG: Gfo/Idh/MocA family oxidoreductase [Candidatus Latescibacterota bacterium]|nr:Gfo/Idh/MocA family oxidoreductase [Candidatus Latescibacterota bacterium]